MGLPIFVTPVEPQVAAKAAEKVPTGPRSSIRRQRTIRGPQARVSAETRRRRMLGMVGEANPGDYEVWENRQTSRSPPNEPDITSVASLHARAHRMFEDERMRLRDTLSFERQHPPTREIDGPLMPPVPESRDYSAFDERRREIQRLHDVRRDLRRIARRRPAPTPPYTESDLAFMARVGTDSPRPSSLTPTLSPPRRPDGGDAENSRSFGSGRIPDFFEFAARESPNMADRPATSILSERVQALNRASNNMERSRRLMRQARLDGLGDRDRSLSPEGGAAWDTLLTSITPDPQPPSAGSSFASTTASAAAAATSSNSGPASGSTSMTSVIRSADSPTLRDCDLSESASNSDDDEDDLYELNDYHPRTRGDRFWRSYADVVTARADRVAQNSGTGDTEHLGGMHRIISRLAERDDIPDEWWAGAGLRREPTT